MFVLYALAIICNIVGGCPKKMGKPVLDWMLKGIFLSVFACGGSGPSILFAALFCCHVVSYINNGRYMFASFNISTVYLSIHVYKNK